jgi:hypothetical protein
MKPGSALAALVSDLAEAFGQPGDQAAVVLAEDVSSGRVVVVVLLGSGPEHDAAVAAYQPKPGQRSAAA